MFDLSADPGSIARALSSDPILKPLVAARPGLRLPGGWDGFEIAVRAGLGQQITLKAATNLVSQAVAELGDPVADFAEVPELTRAFPQAERVAVESLAGLRIPKARAAALAGIAAA